MEIENQELIEILNKTSEIEKLLVPAGGSFMPTTKIINNKPAFILWKSKLQYQLQHIKQEPVIIDTLALLDNGFKNGFSDENDFNELKAKLSIIASHIEHFADEGEPSVRLKKGTNVQTAFDEYTLIEQIGSGGNGRVFSAKNKDNEIVAIKFVEKNISADKLRRFKNEIHFCEYHDHKNIVQIKDRGYAYLDGKDYAFYIMPLYADTLRDKIKLGIAPANAIMIFEGLIEGLYFAHKFGTIHRDIKPENIMFAAESFEPIICDFGIAHFAENELITAIETKASDRMANFQYAAPEQRIKGGKISPQTDVYATALILNEMFTHQIPQAAGYTTIASVIPEYAFLDTLFSDMYKQNAIERLYPATAILTELSVLSQKSENTRIMQEIKTRIANTISPENFETAIQRIKYADGELKFFFDRDLPSQWYQCLAFGSYSHSALVGYEKEKVTISFPNVVCMPMRRNETEATISEIVKYMRDWVEKANSQYSAEIKRQAEFNQREAEKKKLAEIERLGHESALNEFLSKL